MNYSVKYIKICYMLFLVIFSQKSIMAFRQDQQKEFKREIDSLTADFDRYFFSDTPNVSEEIFRVSFLERADELLGKLDKEDMPDLHFSLKDLIYHYFSFKHDTIMSLAVLNETIAEAQSLNMPKHEANFLIKKGVEYMILGANDSALSNFNKSIYLANTNKLEGLLGYTYNSMAIIYQELNDHVGALQKFHQALAHLSVEKNLNMVAVVYSNLGNISSDLEYGDSVFFYARKLEELNKELQSDRHSFQIKELYLAGAYLEGDYEGALAYADSLTVMIDEKGYKGAYYNVKYFLSKTMFETGNKRLAYSFAEQALNNALENKNTKAAIKYYNWLIWLDKYYGEYKQALNRLEVLAGVLDSLNEKKSEQQLQLLLINNELENKDRSILELNRHHDLDKQLIHYQKLLIITGGLFFILFVVGLIVFYKRRVELQFIKAKDAENRLLLAQLEPHFIFNAMSSVQYYLLEENGKDDALNYLQKFARLIRRVLDSTRSSLVPLEEELETIRFFLDIQRVRFENSFQYSINLDLTERNVDLLIPPMFVQPFIENAVEYGVKEVTNGEINIHVCQQGDTLIMTIDDNGLGLEAETKKKKEHRSQATKITEERIDVIRKLLKRNASFSVFNRFDVKGQVLGVRVKLELPIVIKPI
ncbi:histidine kinase [Roseivirga pacifica]|uniref:histidine kinase n=1 Tax=Roseivirga pacifica TaxID=1267423 RepID=UPI003BAE5753